MSNYKWYGDEILANIEAATIQAGLDCGLDLKGRSQDQAPIESGDLKGNASVAANTGVLSAPEIGEAVSRPLENGAVRVGYTLPYAFKQHEDLSLKHNRTDGYRIQSGKNAGRTVNMIAGGKAKFLEDPFNENVEKYQQHYANEIRKVIQ